jgi:hypothetical protein
MGSKRPFAASRMNVGSRITVSTILIVLHKSHLSADGAKSAVGMATAGRCKKLSGDACDAFS